MFGIGVKSGHAVMASLAYGALLVCVLAAVVQTVAPVAV